MKDDRNYKGYGNNDSNFYWPNKSKLALQFVLNYEEGAENSIINGDEGSETFLSEIINAKQIIGARNMNMESIYEYGSRRGFWRIHNEFEKRKLPLTIFGVGMALEKNPDVCEQIIKSKYEVASHGYRWIDYQNITEEVEKEHTIKCNNIIKDIFGYFPSGWYTGRTFIDSFKNIYEESKFITEHADKKRPFKNKKEMILIFLELFDNLDEETKINIIKKHPDLADKIKINKGLSELSDEEQSRSGLKDCSEQEFNLFKDLNSRFKNKFNIPFIFAVRNKNKNEIITEFKSRLDNNDLNLEIKTSISQVKEIAKLRLTELINE